MSEPRTKYTYNQPPIVGREWANAGTGDITSANAKYFEFLDPDPTKVGGNESAVAAGTGRVLVSGGYILNEGTAALRVRIFGDEKDARAGTAWNKVLQHLVVPPGTAGNPSRVEWTGMSCAVQIYADGANAVFAGAGKTFWLWGLK